MGKATSASHNATRTPECTETLVSLWSGLSGGNPSWKEGGQMAGEPSQTNGKGHGASPLPPAAVKGSLAIVLAVAERRILPKALANLPLLGQLNCSHCSAVSWQQDFHLLIVLPAPCPRPHTDGVKLLAGRSILPPETQE